MDGPNRVKPKDAEAGTPAGERLDVLVTLVEAYEAKHWAIDPPDAIDAIKIRMEQRGLTRRHSNASSAAAAACPRCSTGSGR